MNFEELIAKVGVYAASLVIGFVSGLVPFVNAELFLVLVSPIVARHSLLPIAAIMAVGQMAAKTILFYAGRGVFNINMGRLEKRIEAVQRKFKEWENKVDLLVFVSASVGIPPFYVLSFVAGALKLHILRFLSMGLVGRSIRFAVIIYFPQLVLKYI